jgi:hypothetical protein
MTPIRHATIRREEGAMNVTVWHKTDQTTMFQPYEAGHRVGPVFHFELDQDEWLHLTGAQARNAAAALDLAEDAFAAFNGEPSEGWEDRSEAYYAAGNRSLSVGDLVVFGEVALAVDPVGFRAVSVPRDPSLEHRLERLRTTPAVAGHEPPQLSA